MQPGNPYLGHAKHPMGVGGGKGLFWWWPPIAMGVQEELPSGIILLIPFSLNLGLIYVVHIHL